MATWQMTSRDKNHSGLISVWNFPLMECQRSETGAQRAEKSGERRERWAGVEKTSGTRSGVAEREQSGKRRSHKYTRRCDAPVLGPCRLTIQIQKYAFYAAWQNRCCLKLRYENSLLTWEKTVELTGSRQHRFICAIQIHYTLQKYSVLTLTQYHCCFNLSRSISRLHQRRR